MKFQFELAIDRNLTDCVNIFEDQKNNSLWEPELVSSESFEFSTDRRLNHYRVNGRMITVVIKTVENNLPEKLETTAEMDGLTVYTEHSFIALEDGRTVWKMLSKVQVDSFLLKIMFFLMPSLMKNRTRLYMEGFKKYAESSKSN